MKLGSLFDGSGGFPLAGALCGIEPIWASEVEPYPIAVTSSRFPNIKHLGDISKINGGEIEPVDIITFGSPCQDLSVAGKRAGLKHEANGDDETTRSGLFMEAVRIIKEMREKTNGVLPRFAVWENVPGAFSSNKGEDFRIVLEELIKIAEPNAVMPAVPQFGWPYADSYCGNGWSLAYRVFDAQYWGVPQRRRRIYLVADFGGECAREILFEREGLRGYFTEGRTPWQATPTDAERSIGADDREGEIPYTLKIRSGVSVDSYGKAAGKGALIQKNLSATLGVSQDQYLFQPVGADPYNGEVTGDKAATLGVNCGMSSGRNGVVTLEPGIAAREGGHIYEDVSGTLRANAGDNQMAVAYGIDHVITTGGNCTAQGSCVYEDVQATLKAGGPHAVAYGVVTKGNGDAFLAEERHTALTVGGGQAGQGYPCTMQPIAVATQQGGAEITENGVCPTITAAAGMSGNNQPWICQGLDAYNQALTGDKAKTLNSAASDADHVPCVVVDNIGGQNEYGRESDVAPCLKATHYKNPPCVVDSAGFCTEHSAKSRSIGFEEEVSPTLRAGVTPACVYSVENHPNDSRVKIDESGKVQALTGRMGTGGGNVPMVMEPFCKSRRAQTADDATTWKHGKVANTLNTFDQGEARANELIVETVALEGNGQRPSHRGDGYAETDKSYTLNATEKHGVAYSFDPGASRDVGVLFIEECGKTLTNGTCPGHHDGVVIATNTPEPVLTASKASFFMRTEEELASTLVATDYKDPQLVAFNSATRKYIVRRLTPTECARLQGFADRWGDIDAKTDLTDKEYKFWLDVRNTHAAINGKAVKEYTKAQMLTWYNKLHTDSAEYKLWGNGIALPTALYVIQGISEVMKGTEEND